MIWLTKILKPLWIGVALAAGMYELSVNDKVILIAEDYVGVTELPNTNNRSPEIDYWNKRLRIPMGSSYCAAFVSFVLDSAGVQVPSVRSGVAQHFITNKSISAARVLDKRNIIPAGSIVVWKRGETWMGHVGIVTHDWSGPTGKTIEANTSPTDAGSQADGDGVWRKRRTINPTAFFRITHFTLIN